MFTIVGGAYREVCLHPRWENLFGSGLRAAAAVSELANNGLILHTCAHPSESEEVQLIAKTFGIEVTLESRPARIEFQYDHELGPPRVYPAVNDTHRVQMRPVSASNVLVFGQIEASSRVSGSRVVYDPQAGARAVPFSALDSSADHLSIVANRAEVAAMAATLRPGQKRRCSTEHDAALVREAEGAEAVVVKCGSDGALVASSTGMRWVDSIKTDRVFAIGSGDVFSAAYAVFWTAGNDAVLAARRASTAASLYCGSGTLPIARASLRAARLPATRPPGRHRNRLPRVYLAAALSTLPQVWFVNEVRRCLEEQGLDVFSPKDDVGFAEDIGDPEHVAKADLRGLDRCDAILALVDTLSPGMLFEVGYAHATSKPVIAFNQKIPPNELTMLVGTQCEIFDGLASAVYATAWKAKESRSSYVRRRRFKRHVLSLSTRACSHN